MQVDVEIGCFSQSARQLDEICDEAERIIRLNQPGFSLSGLSLVSTQASNLQSTTINSVVVNSRIVTASFNWWGDET